jgi:hypothetical protein
MAGRDDRQLIMPMAAIGLLHQAAAAETEDRGTGLEFDDVNSCY